MSKDIRVNSSSFDRSVMSPNTCSLNISNGKKSGNVLPAIGDEREWEETRCSICIEHPHNVVLLICSSQEKGCRPFMCDTSYRHSNCLDQFRKLSEHQSELVCPLCRGLITGWIVINEARNFMNSKIRSCSLETCNFFGDYGELRKHARVEHPSNRPSVVSPTRQLNWTEQERVRDLNDALSFQFDSNNDDSDETNEYDFGSDESLLDGMSGYDLAAEINDIFGGGIFSLPQFGFSYSSSSDDEMLDFSNQISSVTLERMSNLTSPSSRSSLQGQNGPISRGRSSYHISRESSNTTISRSRPRSHRDNANSSLAVRSSNRRENVRTNWVRLRSDGMGILPNTLASGNTRSSNRRENVRTNGVRLRSDGMGIFPPPVRRAPPSRDWRPDSPRQP